MILWFVLLVHVLELQTWKTILKTHGIIFLTAVISWLIFYINVNYLCVLQVTWRIFHILGFQEKDDKPSFNIFYSTVVLCIVTRIKEAVIFLYPQRKWRNVSVTHIRGYDNYSICMLFLFIVMGTKTCRWMDSNTQ